MKSSNIQPLALILIFFNLFHGCVAALNCSSPSPESLFKELEDQLFRKNLIPPVANFSEPLRITLSITVVGILGVDEKAQTLTTFLWQVLEWNIPGLSWDEQKCGTERVSVLREKLWVPDVHISEFMDENKSPQTPYVYLNNTGHVYDDKPIRVVSSCKLEIYNFPFDIQYCTLTFGSYLHFASEIQMLPGRTGEETLSGSKGVLETNGAWELSEIKVFPSELELDVGSYSELKFQLVLRRRPILYVVNLLVPSCFLVTVDLISFLLPPQSVDRASFKMTLILGYTVFLLIMNDLLPVTGGRTPLINVFFSISLALMVASLLETVFITNIQFSSSQYSAVPHWLSVLVLRYLAIVVCLSPKKSNRVTVCLNPSYKDPTANTNSVTISGNQDISKEPQPVKASTSPAAPPEPALEELKKLTRHLSAIRLQVDKHFQGSRTAEEWQMIGIVIDRLLFYLYIVFIIASFITITGIWIWNNTYAP
ncbi:5-hydroxytryptamine receptor 3A-like isoform X1 [Gambusia affinis]|uniref:5-hydroxytryptamine receptor 3A-like isoform X1 n=1 Tax=Gambusia affinis TaxID=33528 RepID=UPI001CDD4C87|nr:5-hydroxytryptamine receptor 3A-like isoform X1 [Gambusia affinis]